MRDLSALTPAELRAYQAAIDDAVIAASKSGVPTSSAYELARLAYGRWWAAEREMQGVEKVFAIAGAFGDNRTKGD